MENPNLGGNMKGSKIKGAIRILKINKVLSSGQTAFCEAVDIVIEAMEKKLPKKPIEPQEDYGTFMCPSCRGLIYTEDTFETHRYCLLCGQELDWSN